MVPSEKELGLDFNLAFTSAHTMTPPAVALIKVN
jgi:hypothetical protein